MPIDIRATVYCSLGNTVISGNVSDSYLQGAGLVKTTGQVVLGGVYAPSIGQDVQFGYYQNGILGRIPRALKVLSYFADPFRNETTVELGDILVYSENRKPPLENPTAADENSDIPCEVLGQAIIPISASYVFQECLTALGITATGYNLTNKFSVEEFDMTDGYISVMDQLLVSECQFGYIDENGILVVKSFNDAGGTGPSLNQSDLIDVAGIGSGELPGDAVAVNYTSLKLKPPDELESEESIAEKNWEYELETVTNSDVEMDTVNNLEVVTYTFKNYEIRETHNKYDSWNRKIEAITDIKKSIIVANPSYVESAYSFNLVNIWDYEYTQGYVENFKRGVNTIEVVEREERYWKYTTKAVGTTDGCQYQEASEDEDLGSVKEEEYYLYQTKMGIAAAMNLPSYYYGYFNSSTNPVTLFTPDYTDASYCTKKQLIEYESVPITTTQQKIDGKKTDVESETTKTVTTDWVAQLFTKEGQQLYAALTASNIRYDNQEDGVDLSSDFDVLIERASMLVVENVRTENYYGANFGMQVRPTTAERTNAANQKEDPTESTSEVEWVTGSETSTNVIEFDLPYAPDDEITWNESTGYGSIPSDAAAKAKAYGDIQNRLLYGNRYGVNIQISVNLLPSRPFDPIYINATGIMGQYRVNGTNWAFDRDGIVASVDALFWGAVGAS